MIIVNLFPSKNVFRKKETNQVKNIQTTWRYRIKKNDAIRIIDNNIWIRQNRQSNESNINQRIPQ